VCGCVCGGGRGLGHRWQPDAQRVTHLQSEKVPGGGGYHSAGFADHRLAGSTGPLVSGRFHDRFEADDVLHE